MTHDSATIADRTYAPAGGLPTARRRLRMLEVLLTPAAARLGGVYVAPGPFVSGAAAPHGQADIVVALVFDASERPAAERAIVVAAAAAGLKLRIDPQVPDDGASAPRDRLVFGERRSLSDGRRPVRPAWTRGPADIRSGATSP
ncbi:hypothetical protein [Methylobacterium brachiatum]